MLTIKEFRNNTGVSITEKHTGKMSELSSLSTSNMNNPNCLAYKEIKGSICQHCFACTMCKRYSNLDNMLKRNADILTSRLLTADELPTIKTELFRFEAFGDLYNDIQLINYFNIAKANPNVHCALWTKNYHIVKRVIESGHDKPENLQIVVSSLFMNDELNIDGYKYADKVFTVYDREHAEQVEINCGARDCNRCRKCYLDNEIKYIHELLK